MSHTRALQCFQRNSRMPYHRRLFLRPTFTQFRAPSLMQRRTYMYRLVNHQRLLMSLNTLRTMMRSPMFYYQIAGIGLFSAFFYWYHLERVPISGRLRFNIISDHWEKQLGKVYLEREMEQNGDKILPPTSPEHCLIQRILDRLVTHSGFSPDQWEIHVISHPQPQAFVLPGGKVFVHTSMLDLCSREDEVAVVLAHEMMHTIMHHGSEELSRLVPILFVDILASLLSGLNEDLVVLATDVAFRLPRSRDQETEADYYGLLLAAKSGYDPSAARDLWTKWEAREEHAGPEYLRTHPSPHSRTAQFHEWLLNAKERRVWGRYPEEEFDNIFAMQRSYCGVERCPRITAQPTQSTVAGILETISSPLTRIHEHVRRVLAAFTASMSHTFVCWFDANVTRLNVLAPKSLATSF